MERKSRYTCQMDIGDQLAALLWAQEAEAQAVRFPAIEAHAVALVALGQRLNDPVIWPVGAAAERIAGAATLMSSGSTRVREWNSEVRGERVLVFSVAALTPLALFAAAVCALSMGAESVEACGVHVDGVGTDLGPLAAFHEVSGRLLTGVGAR